jgi:hypothetical protein
MRLRLVLGLALVLLPSAPASARVAPADVKRADRVAMLIDWAKKEGRPSKLAGEIAHEFGFEQGRDDFPVVRKGFQDDITRTIYVVNLLQVGNEEAYVLFRTTTETSTIWKVVSSGAIEDVYLVTRTQRGHSQDFFPARLEETLDFLEGQHERRSTWKQDPTAAIGYFDRRISANPTDADAWEGRCWVRTMIGQFKDALADCAQSWRLKPNVAQAARSLAYLKWGELDKALEDFEAILRRDAKDQIALYGRGLIRLKRGDVTGGNADIAAAKAHQSNIADEFASWGVGPSL